MEYPKYSSEDRRFHVLSLPVDGGGCGWMRIRSPFKMINRLRLADAQILDEGQLREDEFKKIIASADIIVARPGSYRLMREIKELFPFKKIIVDFDDDVFNIQPSSEHYRHYGTEDIVIPVNGKDVVLWKSGVNGFNRFDNMKRLVDLRWMMDKADVITAVTENLAKWMAELSGKDVRVVPNVVDFTLFPDVEVNDKLKVNKFRVGFCGGASHFGDIQMIKEEMIKFLKNTPNAELHLIGQRFDAFDGIDNVVQHNWVAFEANPFRMKLLDLDVMIAPLEDTDFNRRKDPLKFWDASGLAVPLVASNVSPFKDVIKDGETGFLFDEPEDMKKILIRLNKDRDLGKKVGLKARESALKDRNLELFAPKLVEFYKEVWKQKRF